MKNMAISPRGSCSACRYVRAEWGIQAKEVSKYHFSFGTPGNRPRMRSKSYRSEEDIWNESE